MAKKPKKEYSTLHGVQMSFIATISLAKQTWTMEPSAAVDWYIDHLDRQNRQITKVTARQFRLELEEAFWKWIEKNVNKKRRQGYKLATTNPDEDTKAAIAYLEELGYQIRRIANE